MTQKHTQGPWTVTENKTIDGDIMICVVAANGVTVIWQAYDNLENRKIAALIAAAPDLLEALKIAREQAAKGMMFAGELTRQAIEAELVKVDSAIAKAEQVPHE